MNRLKTLLTLLFAVLATVTTATAQRRFLHPGITYTQADIDRMRAMIDAQREPYYSAFKALKNDPTSSPTYQIRNVKPTSVGQDKMDALLQYDGHAALNTALMWRLTDDERYARKAVEILNNFNGITNVSNRGTMALNASKVHLLIEAAELMRDYAGWAAADQQAFKAMLVYPGYSTTQDMNKRYASLTESQNRITWYWNAYQFDWGRHGNQETLPMRMVMALGIYLDNDTIYQRARRYYLGLPHMEGDLPYVSGPPRGINLTPTTTSDYFDYYATPNRTFGTTADYGYNGQLLNYVWHNGQQQETSRDQGHAAGGIGSLANIAEMAWNQGDDLYNVYDNRLLLGFEWYNRYNLSYLQSYTDQPAPWEPTGYTTQPDEATFDNGLFVRQRDRTQQWFSRAPNPTDESLSDRIVRGTQNTKVSAWLTPYMHYAVRMGYDQTATDHSDMGRHPSMLWLSRAYEKATSEGQLEDNGWSTDWVGWSNLTKTRTAWMAGQPCTCQADGSYQLGIHHTDEQIRLADYDVFNTECSGQGHTYYDTTTGNSAGALRSDDVDIAADGDGFAVCDVAEGEWLSYTLRVERGGAYQVYITYKATAPSQLGVAADGSSYAQGTLPTTGGLWSEQVLTEQLVLEAGAAVVRLKATGSVAHDLQLRSMRIVKSKAYTFVPAEWQRSNATSTATFETVDGGIEVTATNTVVGAHAQWNLTDADYAIGSERHLFVVKGCHIRPSTLRLTSLCGITPATVGRHYSVAAADGDSIFVWNLLNDANLQTLLGSDMFTLSAASFYASNDKGQLTFRISDVNFYSEAQLQTLAAILPTAMQPGTTDSSPVYTIDGRQVSGSRQQPKGIVIKNHRKVVVSQQQ